MKKIAIINGVNLNMLGHRNPQHYGSLTYQELLTYIRKHNRSFALDFFQSNHEGELVEFIHKAIMADYDGLIINPGAYAHTSIAIMDALEMFKNPKVEVHLSDVEHREAFRQILLTSRACDCLITNHQTEGYLIALAYIKRQLDE